ncbi:hypothetical protein LK09_14795 [Microbacterium mangrovi]|uniref:Uncharacterized protein n=1 Tax=Microbacterium mangrovi TaxID=1348253 RepID=A0A0B2A0Q1_9MICO|nr:hypothetical protein [Microbacterium mangrovi]KHK96596.1 hypothetical protein LK09_14795 [Microbacterium mangrovi]
MDDHDNAWAYRFLLITNVVVAAAAAFWGQLLNLDGDACNEVDPVPQCNYAAFVWIIRIATIFPIAAVIVTSVLAFGVFRERSAGLVLMELCSPFIIFTSIAWTWLASVAAGVTRP